MTTVESIDAETMKSPCGLTAQPRTAFVCPEKVRRSFPVATSHTFNVSSSDAETMKSPCGLTTQAFTQPVCPERVRRAFPVATSHTFNL